MHLNISARHEAKISDSVREHISSRLLRQGDHYEKVTRMNIIIDKDAQGDLVEASFHVNGKELFAKAKGDNLYAAIDALGGKVERQLTKAKEKQSNKRGIGLKHQEIIADSVTDEELEAEEYSEEV
ncbi:ribosome hibernation-promoting factor, HPF/YfiA family [Motiliproteus sp. MSK22-1]|uniref:ribosome hibernation-promoting factor, HPF/YfiA family n=1 Tax=Motiliproteus sp. MSK22-1 TaxID=1897630 RepID=UPI000977847A|nr:ribosome-associated translation inhibitor RaiA [Motiliproteus sp. MSK22-1]OMH32700.1 ribosomal subunit interface protein [Motiliproteus sp. MSK22-1]